MHLKILGIILAVASLSFAAVIPGVSGTAQAGASQEQASIPSSVVINHPTFMSQNLVAGNITVDKSASLYTDGYSIICSGNFTNNGLIVTGSSQLINYTESYGGSGGGGIYYLNPDFANETAYSTSVSGGRGSYIGSQSGNSGATPSMPHLLPALLQNWYKKGFTNFLSGAAGQSAGSYSGGTGSFGLYIQASSIINNGVINSNGGPGNGWGPDVGLSGGGGAGSVILAYSSVYKMGTIYHYGGASSISANFTMRSGPGGDGTVNVVKYSGSGPINAESLNVKAPIYAFPGAYLNYTVTENNSGKVTTSYVEYSVLSAYSENQSFYYRTVYGKNLDLPSTLQYSSFGLPFPFPFYASFFLSELNNSTLNSLLEIDALSTAILSTHCNITVNSISYSTIEVGAKSSLYGNFLWIDNENGMVVKQLSTAPNDTFSVSFSHTNIFQKNTGKLTDLLVILGVVSVAIVLAAAAVTYSRRGGVNLDEKEYSMPDPVTEARIEELDSMLSKGVISREYHDESVRLLRRKM